MRVRRMGMIGLALLAACGAVVPSTTGDSAPEKLTLLAHDSFVGGVTEQTFAAFTAETGTRVELLQGGDAGTMLAQAIITKNDPIADILFGVDDTFLSKALQESLFVPYESPLLGDVPGELQLDSGHRVTPIDYGDVCLNYDKAAFGDGLAPPASLDELTDPAYRSMLVVENPATSSPGLAFLLATIAEYGDQWPDFWHSLVDNDVEVSPSWDDAYYSRFSAHDGDRPLVVSYASSPPAEVIYATQPMSDAPTGVITAGCYRQVEFAGILAGTSSEPAAGGLIDFMLQKGFQDTIPLTWFVYPANRQAELPEQFVQYTDVPDDPAQVAPEEIEVNRQSWIEQWQQIVLP
ncbi:MAG TPA: thiamine ABC transporter substrate-binding protein [Acidimicrobiia bacterium]